MATPSEQTLLVTGANGFVALHVIKEALSRGYHVRGTVRSESSASKVRSVFQQHASKLSLSIVSDLTKPELYQEAFAETITPITGVIHVAAPFSLNIDDVTRDLLDPAVKNSVGILEATKKFGSNVRRIVNTSSFAAILDLGQGYRPGYTYSENDWNPMTYSEASTADASTAYCASKGLAEKTMWDWMEREQPSFSLASINPPWIFGPHALWRLVNATEVPPVDFGGFADVRVVAIAHLQAFEKPEAAGNRFLVGSHFDYHSAVEALVEELPELKNRLPKGTPGAEQVGKVYALNGEKAKRVLGIDYIPLNKTMKDSFQQFLKAEKRVAAV
ncbi:NADPH-dependent methylglyoxal reductase GRE2 [Cladobotryum mycophilum]|uniref:NADPH-dependent methylglyoxal reductase GRE2 n=1 Tax=Cladobotryum mycophilum TaxID=491253 RepID=A0ABR0SW06_9HYPO